MSTCAAFQCDREVSARGYCHMHYKRLRRNGDVAKVARQQRVVINIEDVEWMAETGESLEGAARRYGIKPSTLTDRLRDAGRPDLTQRLRLRNSVGAA